MTDGQEHKGKKSVAIQQEVIINGILKASALDISEAGMYVSTQAELLAGAVLDLSFRISEVQVSVKALVENSQPGIGVGVKFVGLAPESYTLIKNFVERSGAGSTATAPRKEGKNILLVDDSAQSRGVYKNKLSLEGFTVAEASNGVEALKHLQEARPDLVILDLWMEGIDGFKILQLMQLNPNLKDIPVIVLSARSVPADIQKAISLGAKEYMPKMSTTPIKLAEKVKETFLKMR